MDFPTHFLASQLYTCYLFFCKQINTLSTINTYILLVVNHILKFILVHSLMDIFVVEVIKKPMDIDSPNRIISNLGTNPSLYCLSLAQIIFCRLNPSPQLSFYATLWRGHQCLLFYVLNITLYTIVEGMTNKILKINI